MHNRGARTQLEQGRSPQAVIKSEARGREGEGSGRKGKKGEEGEGGEGRGRKERVLRGRGG